MSKHYEGYNEINKRAPRPMNTYEVTQVIEELGKNEEECKRCPDYPCAENNYEPCGCMKVSQEQADVCVCASKED